MEGDGLCAEGEFLVVFGLCREQLENHVLETRWFPSAVLTIIMGGGSIHIVFWFKLATCLHGHCYLAFFVLPRFSCSIRTWLFATRTCSIFGYFAFGKCYGRGALNRFSFFFNID